MLEFYLLVTLIVSVFLFCTETLITLYFPYKNIKTKYIVNSIFCAIIMFSIMSYTMYLSSIVMSEITIFLISGTIGIIMSILMYKDKMRNINQKDVVTEARENLITELKKEEEELQKAAIIIEQFKYKMGKSTENYENDLDKYKKKIEKLEKELSKSKEESNTYQIKIIGIYIIIYMIIFITT